MTTSASRWWLVGVAAAFAVSELLFVPPRMGLSWDEVVYVSQVSARAPAAYFDAARARGVPLLVAPVTMLTSSTVALRIYLSILSGLALFGALWVWRSLRPPLVLVVAGVAFGGLWVVRYYGPQAMPDEWVALAGLAAVGFFLRAAYGLARRTALVGLTVCVASAALFRPGDALFLALPLAVAVLVVSAWRRWSLLAGVVVGPAVGAAEWLVEAYIRFGGPLARLHAASREQGGLGLHLAVWDELRAVNGPTLCRPCTVAWRYPALSLWWLALPFLVAFGVFAARRAGRLASSAMAAVCGLSVAAQYLFLVGYAAPRFLIPAYALFAIPVADGIAPLLGASGRSRHPALAAVVGLVLIAQLGVEQGVLVHEARSTVRFHEDYRRIATDLHRAGVSPPCLIQGDQYIPIAFYAGCASSTDAASALAAGQHAALLQRSGRLPPRSVHRWLRIRLRGTRVLRLVAYVPNR